MKSASAETGVREHVFETLANGSMTTVINITGDDRRAKRGKAA